MSGHSNYEPKTGIERWLDTRLPVVRLAYDSMIDFPTPKNLNYWWTFGGILAVCLGIQLVTGIVLAMHYVPHVDHAFASVERIMRDVNYGWLIRYMHANGASMFFIAVYIHMLRGLYYGSYKAPREVLWILGCVIYLLMMATAFMGYVLPWGQMSFHGAVVITNLFGALPIIGEPITTWLWGGFAVDNPTDAANLAVRMENDAATAWRAVLEQSTDSSQRAVAVSALTQSAVLAARWKQVLEVWPVTQAFPGGPE